MKRLEIRAVHDYYSAINTHFIAECVLLRASGAAINISSNTELCCLLSRALHCTAQPCVPAGEWTAALPGFSEMAL